MSNRLGRRPPIEAELPPYRRYFRQVDSGKAQRELGCHPRGARAVFEPTVKWVRASA